MLHIIIPPKYSPKKRSVWQTSARHSDCGKQPILEEWKRSVCNMLHIIIPPKYSPKERSVWQTSNRHSNCGNRDICNTRHSDCGKQPILEEWEHTRRNGNINLVTTAHYHFSKIDYEVGSRSDILHPVIPTPTCALSCRNRNGWLVICYTLSYLQNILRRNGRYDILQPVIPTVANNPSWRNGNINLIYNKKSPQGLFLVHTIFWSSWIWNSISNIVYTC